MEELSMGTIKFRTYDLGGHFQGVKFKNHFNWLTKKARKIWKEYFPDVNAVVFLVDSCASDRFEESKKELDVQKFGWLKNH